MHAFYADQFVLPLPEGHRFPMRKYRLLRDALATHLPEILLHTAPVATRAELLRVHHAAYIDAVLQGTLSPAAQRDIGFPWSPAMAERALRSVGATVEAARVAMACGGVAANLAGGTHHAYAERGAGFCVFNDVAVAARALQDLHPGLPVAVIDLDVHQGNGTARIFRDDPTVFTLSLHGQNNFPFEKESSDCDIALPDGCDDARYLAALDDGLQALEAWCEPGLVFFLAGMDVHENDRLGRLKLSAAGIAAREQRVFAWAWQRRIPVVMVMAGGYGRDIEATVALQLHSYRIALEHHRAWF